MKTTFLKFAACLFLWSPLAGAGAATLTWSGGGTDTLASNPVNWSGNVSPQNGDDVIFDGTSTKDCIWNLDIALSSLNINSGYSGTVLLNSNLVIKEIITWTGGGTDTLASNPANWSGGVAPENGDNIVFQGTEDCLWDFTIAPSSLRLNPDFAGTVTLSTNLAITGNVSIEGGDFNLNDKALTVDGDLLIGPNGTLYATSSIIGVTGDWINRGAFVSGSSTVILISMNRTVYGNNTFYNLVKMTNSADTLYFEAGRTQVISNNLIVRGTSGHLLSLRSTMEGQQYSLNAQGTRNMSFVNIKDINNISSIIIDAADSEDGGNNTNINFGGDQCVCRDNLQILVQASSDEWRQPC